MEQDIQYGDYVKMNDRFESVHIWTKELEEKNNGKWIPQKITESEYLKDFTKEPITEWTPPSPDIDNLIEGEVALKAIKKDLQELAKRAIDQNAKIVYGMAYVICEVHLKIKPNKEPNVQECDATEPE